MELTYQSPMMPAAYSVISAEEMTYIDGGAFTLPTVADVANFGINVTVNFLNMMGQAAFSTAVAGMVLMHNDGLSLSQSVQYYWDGQTTAGRVATVFVGGLAGIYVYRKTMQIYNTVKSIYTDVKNIYEETKANQAAAQQNSGLTNPIVAAAA